MAIIRRNGNKVNLEMDFEEYRDLTESLTAAGNDAWHHRHCENPLSRKPVMPMIQHIRASHAQSAWEWSRNIGIPPLNDGEVKSFYLEPFHHLTSVPPPSNGRMSNEVEGK